MNKCAYCCACVFERDKKSVWVFSQLSNADFPILDFEFVRSTGANRCELCLEFTKQRSFVELIIIHSLSSGERI